LQEQDDLKPFAVNGREAKEDEAAEHRPPGGRRLQEILLSPVVVLYPSGPVNLVEEPVHDDQQDDDGEEPCDRLHVKRRRVYR